MNGPTKMYHMKPVIVHDFTVELPKCMYRIKTIHSSRNNADGTEDHVSLPNKKLDIFDQNCQDIPGMAELEAKQNEILEQLAQLKKQIYSLKCDLNIQSGSTIKEAPVVNQCSKRKIKINNIPECLVIHASPTSPPYSLEILQRLLQDEVALTVTSYLHSTVVSLPEPANKLKASLESFQPSAGVPIIQIRLVWKNITSNVEFLLSHIPIAGEVNFLRFLSRSTSGDLNYQSEPNSIEIDSLLDQCYLLVRAKSKSEKTAILQSFSKSLNKSQWLAGRNKPGILDVATFSAVKQCLAPKELNVNLGKWFERCQILISA
ncbi:aaRS-interacting multifunctional protein 2 isoform X2 [Rhynchophorus ferrugineus]|uniref:Multisynthase complex auxiliary component p38 n=1 Tax=Rhynchophorus ferrugineus TaxID=354439 RepID=A0A834M9P0_RHYFE|nr:hypothetical protein GWI33_015486 [Rhynchophorus ferrugineus]